MDSQTSLADIDPEIVAYYQKGAEAQRLLRGTGQLEFERTCEILLRFLPKPSAAVLDLGGGAGIYSLWLARLGYRVHLVDVTPLHIEQAREASRLQPEYPLSSITLGDARRLDFPDDSLDAILLMGPMYHLIEHSDRIAALSEARRVLKTGGVMFVAAISCFASFIDGLRDGSFSDPDFVTIVKQDLATGQHRNPHRGKDYFTTAYLHHTDGLRQEVAESGLKLEKLLAVEGPGWVMSNFEERWQDPHLRENLLEVIRTLEEEPSLIGMSGHFLAIARK